LLAEYEGLQYYTFKDEAKVNVSVADRYYSLASTHPAIAFPKIIDLGKKHLRKLQRDKRGAAVAIEQRILDLLGLFTNATGYQFPAMLNLGEQGRFALGYHHQRAHSISEAIAKKEKRVAEEIQVQDKEEA
jgi:CRISPR-associated protein Csd1